MISAVNLFAKSDARSTVQRLETRRSQSRRKLATTTSDDRRPIKFGTDGWRAVIADDFTFENVRRVAGAIASYVLKHEDASRGVIVGYDTRFGSPDFARVAAEVLASAGIPVKLANDYTPTPAISLAVKGRGRRRRDHLQPQSVELERGEVQRRSLAARPLPPS